MSTGLNSACPLFLHRPDSQRASNVPDAGMLRKMVRDCSCHPVLRGVLENLLNYLTRELPKRAAQGRNLKADRSDRRAENPPDHAQRLPGRHKSIREELPEVSLPAPELMRLQNSCGGATSGDAAPRHLTAFQLLQSKFMRSGSKAPVPRQREVGPLASTRGATAGLKSSEGEGPGRKSPARRGLGPKRGGSVKDIVARFSVAERREKFGNGARNQPPKPRAAGGGSALSALMERFETAAEVRKGSAAARVLLPSDVRLMVARRERRQGSGEDQSQPGKMKDRPGLKGRSSGGLEGPAPGTPRTGSNPGKNPSDPNPEDRRPTGAVKHQICHKAESPEKNSGRRGEARPRSETADARLKHGRPEAFAFRSVAEEFHPEPYQLLLQVEARMEHRVGTITTSSPVWSTCVGRSPDLRPARPPETRAEPPAVAAADGSGDPGPPDSGAGQKSGPGYLIPRRNRCRFSQGVEDRARSFRLPAAGSEDTFLNAARPARPDPGSGPSTCTEKEMGQIKIQETPTECGGDGKARGLTAGGPEDTNPQLREDAEAPAEDDAAPAVTSPGRLREADVQELRPKYKTINYGDPSVKETYKPKTIRFTDTFTF